MSAPQGCTNNKAVVGIFKEALKGKVGADRYRMWFDHAVTYTLVTTVSGSEGTGTADSFSLAEESTEADAVLISVHGQFALDRLRNNYLGEMRGAACQAFGRRAEVFFALNDSKPQQVDLPLDLSSDTPSSRKVEGEKLEDSGQASETTSPIQRFDASHSNRGECDSDGIDNRSRKPGRAKSQPTQRRSRSLNSLLQSSTLHGSQEGENRRSSRRTGNRTVNRAAKPSRGSRRQSAANQTRSVQLDFSDFDAEQGGDHGSSSPDAWTSSASSRRSKKRATDSAGSKPLPARNEGKMHSGNFIPGSSNRLAHTAMVMACQDPSSASPLYLCGPTGTGKTHLLHAIADQLRRRFRLRRVMNLSSEQFTNDFITSVGNSGITSFRRRYRDVDALLVDDVQFLGSKKATLREMLYTVETLSGQGKPLIFAGSESPTDIDGLSNELAGRMASGLVCHLQPLDSEIREKLLRQWIEERCQLEVPDSLIETITPMLSGDGRVISGIVNVLNTLQRMLKRSPSLQELQQFAGQLLRSNQTVATLGLIESAVCQAFHLPPDSLRSKSQTRALSGPRKLAMYLSRQLTPSAYSEIGNHFGGRSHSTAISAEQHVKAWIADGAAIGRGVTAMTARDALDRVETLLRTG